MPELRNCQFCGESVQIVRRPLWHGSHGYHGCYEFDIHCSKCGCRVNLDRNDTVYRSEEEARDNAINAWNWRVNDE